MKEGEGRTHEYKDEWFGRKKVLVRDVTTDHLVRLGSKPEDSQSHRCMMCNRCICVFTEWFLDEYEKAFYIDIVARMEVEIQRAWAKYLKDHGDLHLKSPIVKLPPC